VWAATTRVDKNKKSGVKDYIQVLDLVMKAIKKELSDKDAIEDAIQANQATLPQEPQEEAGTLVVKRGPAARQPSPRHLSTPRHAPTPGPPMPMTLGSQYNYHDGGSDLHTSSVDDMNDEEIKIYLALLDSKSKQKIDANNESFKTYCHSLENMSKARGEEVFKHTSILATERQSVKDQNDAEIQKAEDEAKRVLLSRSAHRRLRTFDAPPRFGEVAPLQEGLNRRKSSDDMMRLVDHVSHTRDGSPTLGEKSLLQAETPDAKVDLLARPPPSPETFHGRDDSESSADAGNGTDSPAKENAKKHESNDGNGKSFFLKPWF
jgi:hypothetical protein